jgi:hypothetical protein
LKYYLFFSQNLADSGYGGRSIGRQQRNFMDKENYSPSKKVRKSLASNWASSGHPSTVTTLTNSAAGLHMRLGHPNVHDSSTSFDAPETPSKSLVGTSDASMLFSPPAILKETALPDDSGAGFSSDSLNVHQDSNYRSNQSGSVSQNSFGGSRPLSGMENRNSSGVYSNSGNVGSLNNGNGGSKKGPGNPSPKSKVS